MTYFCPCIVNRLVNRSTIYCGDFLAMIKNSSIQNSATPKPCILDDFGRRRTRIYRNKSRTNAAESAIRQGPEAGSYYYCYPTHHPKRQYNRKKPIWEQFPYQLFLHRSGQALTAIPSEIRGNYELLSMRFSIPRSSKSEMPRASASSSRMAMSGQDLPCSHLETACAVTPTLDANAFCVSPNRRLASAIFFPKLLVSIIC